MMMGQQQNGQERLFYCFNLDDHVPQNHLLRGIDQVLDAALADAGQVGDGGLAEVRLSVEGGYQGIRHEATQRMGGTAIFHVGLLAPVSPWGFIARFSKRDEYDGLNHAQGVAGALNP